MVFCEFLALRWESYRTGILANPINEGYTEPRPTFFHSCLFFFYSTPTNKPITSELNNQIVYVFGLANHENFPLHIMWLNLRGTELLHCRH